MYSFTNIYAWARVALGASSTDVPDGSLSLLATDEASIQMAVDYPCTVDVNGAFSLTSTVDVASYEKAAGYRTAAAFYQSPASKTIIAKLLTLKVGSRTEQYGGADGSRFVTECFRESARAMRRVACVKAANPIDVPRAASTGRRTVEGFPSLADPDGILDIPFGESDNTTFDLNDGDDIF
jgi:hypothetical protein